jgi:hypothetical protein
MRQITDERPTLTMLLRHAGCTFCRQTLSDLAHSRAAISERDLSVAVIGMSDSTLPLRLLGERYGVAGVAWIGDPHRLMYRALEIDRGRFSQHFGPRVVWSDFLATLRGHGIGRVQGDPFQMPGTAIIHHGVVLRRYVHQTASDSPDLGAFACGLLTESQGARGL